MCAGLENLSRFLQSVIGVPDKGRDALGVFKTSEAWIFGRGADRRMDRMWLRSLKSEMTRARTMGRTESGRLRTTCSLSRFREQALEPGLCEVYVVREGIRDARVLHHDEADAVNQAPR